MQLTHKLIVQASYDAAAKRKLFFVEDHPSAEVTTATFERGVAGEYEVQPTETVDVNFGGLVDVRGCYVETDRPVNLRVNGSTEPLPLIAAPAQTVAKFFMEAEINQLSLENTDDETAAVVAIFLWGDPEV